MQDRLEEKGPQQTLSIRLDQQVTQDPNGPCKPHTLANVGLA